MINHKLITPEGTKDYIFDEADARHEVSQKLSTLFEQNAYRRVITSGLEYMDVFAKGIPNTQMYKLVDSEGRLMVLRPDSTNPIARLCSTRLAEEALPIRIYYSQEVYFSNRSMTGKSNEVLQAGIELVGASGERADIEVLSLALSSLELLSNENYRLEIGHIGLFNSLIDSLTADDEIKEQIRIYVEGKNYPALNDMLDQLGQNEITNAIKQLPSLFGGEEVIEKARGLITDEKSEEILNHLCSLLKKLKALSKGGEISLDLGIVNRTDYYTGIVFKGYIEGCFGEAIVAGGRYDKLMGSFLHERGAVGFAVNVDGAIKNVQHKRSNRSPQVLVYCGDSDETEALLYRNKISQTVVAEFCVLNDLDAAIEYANKRGISELHIVKNGKVEKRDIGGREYETT